MNILFALLISFFSSFVNAQNMRTVSFTSADGGLVHADYYQYGPEAIVLAHGAIFNKESWQKLANNLTNGNFSVLAIDFRGYGKSTAGIRPGDKYEDILAAVRFLHQQADITRVSVLGASMGGGAAAQAAIHAQAGEISRLILLSPMPIKEPEKLQGNLLFIASRQESMVDSINSQFQRAPEPKQLKLIDGKAHAQHIFNTSEAANLTRIIIDFMNKP